MKDAEIAPRYAPWLSGALAYLEGRAADALRAFDGLDLENLDAAAKGLAALALAALNAEDDVIASQRHLAIARQAAPGSLVEEAALRRSILIASENGEVDDFERFVSRYLRKFRGSIYAGNFRRRLAAAITRMRFIDDPAAFDRLETLLAPMTPAGRQELHLLIARAALENGNRIAASLAAARVVESAEDETLDHRRAQLYGAAADVVDPAKFSEAVATLERLRTQGLPEDDRSLLQAAERLSLNVTELPQAAPAVAPAPEEVAAIDESAGGPVAPVEPNIPTETPPEALPVLEDVAGDAADDGPFSAPSPIEARVADALAAVDALLETSP